MQELFLVWGDEGSWWSSEEEAEEQIDPDAEEEEGADVYINVPESNCHFTETLNEESGERTDL